MSNKKRFADLMKQLPLSVGFLGLAGAVTYLIIMLLRCIADICGAVGLVHTVLVGIAVAVGLVLFAAATYLYMQKIGVNDADFVKDCGVGGAEAKPYMKGAALLFVISLAVYCAVLWLMSLAEWDFLSGSAAYIAAALNYRWGTPFDGVQLWCNAVGFAVTAASLFPSMLAGYKKGFETKTEK